MTTIIRGYEAVQETRTTAIPTSYDVGEALSASEAWRGYCKGYVCMWYTHSNGWKCFGVYGTLEECVDEYDGTKNLCKAFPDVFNWFDYSDFVVYKDNGHELHNDGCTRWYPCAMIIED